MHFSLKTVAIATCASLAFGTVAAPPAGASTKQSEITVSVTGETSRPTGERIDAELRKDSRSRFTFVHPAAAVGVHEFNLHTVIRTGGYRLPPFWGADTSTHTEDGADVVEFKFTDPRTQLEVTRTFRIKDGTVRATVQVRNVSDAPADITIDLANEFVNPGGMHAQVNASGAFEVAAESEGYETTVAFADPASSASMKDMRGEIEVGKTGVLGGDTPRFQMARWENTLAPGDVLEGGVDIAAAAQDSAIDTDGDGLRDEWEVKGVRLPDGTELPIHRWGADPKRPDLFLQLNWMEAEWETMQCSRQHAFAPTAPEFAQFAGCATANVNSYRPTTATLRELEGVFEKRGIALHIDAGDSYQSESLVGFDTPRGGKTEPFEKYYFDAKTQGERLIEERDRLLGDRKSVFRLGIIGDRMAANNRSSGVALVSDSAFYVSNHKDMTTQEQLRNTIFHEFGHTLGLGHSGPLVPENPLRGDLSLPDYKSVMNYQYQFGKLFDYAGEDTKTRVNGCLQSGDCGEHDVVIPADWANLDLPGFNVGKGDLTTGSGEIDEDEHHEKDPRRLAANAAAENSGRAGFYMDTTRDGVNGIVTSRTDNALRGTISNLGADVERFTVEATYPGGQRHSQVVELPAIGKAGDEREIRIPIKNAASLTGPVMPVHIQITNHSGERVFAERYEVSVLDYTAEEARRVLDEVLASDASLEVKRLAKSKLDGIEDPAAAKPTNQHTKRGADGTQKEKPAEEPSSVAIVIAVLLALGGVGAAGLGWAMSQGLI